MLLKNVPGHQAIIAGIHDAFSVATAQVFWLTFGALGLIADVTLPLLWSVLATIPIGMFCWWVAYRSDWF